MVETLGRTKALIVAACAEPKTWSELAKLTKKSDPTLMVHLEDLQKSRLIIKKKDGKYHLRDRYMALELTDSLIKENLQELQNLLLFRAKIEQKQRQ